MAEDVEEKSPPPALYFHCRSVYTAMEERASVSKFHVLAEDSEEGLIYEGYLSRLITNDVGLAIPYYTHVMRELKRMGCVEQLRRGGSTTPSRWLLHYEPTEELYGNPVPGHTQLRAKKVQQSISEQMLGDVSKRLSEVEDRYEELLEVVVALNEKLEKLANGH